MLSLISLIGLSFILVLSCISALAYHLGGLGADGIKKYPKVPAWLFSRQIRMLICPLTAILAIWVCKGINDKWWVYLLTYGLQVGAITTYWKKKDEDARWYHWFLHGFMLGVACLLLVFVNISIWQLLIRAIVMGILMTVISESTTKAWLEEGGRGFIIPSTVLLL